MKKFLLVTVLLYSNLFFSQEIKGKIYDESTTVKGALIVNINQDLMTYTNEEGEFSIQAKVNDSIYVSSLFHAKQFKVLEEIDFNQTVIFELVKTVNELDEVYLEKINEKKFDSIKTNEQLHVQIKSDIEKNPHLYSPPSNGNMDFIAIAKLIAGLFKNKNKDKKQE